MVTGTRPSGRPGASSCTARLVPQWNRRAPTSPGSARASTPAAVRFSSMVATTSAHVSARSNPSGRSTGSSVRATDRTRSHPERAHARCRCRRRGTRCGPSRTRPSGWTMRSALDPLAVGVAQLDLAPLDHRLLQLVEVRRWGRGRSPQLAGSSITAEAAASASARKVSGRACTSLRRAALASGVADDDGPATRNRVRASAAVRPAEVGAGPAEQRPPPAPPGLRVDGDAGHAQRLEVAPGGRSDTSSSLGHLGRRDPALGLQHEEGGHEAIGAHEPSVAPQTGQDVATSMKGG